MPLPPEIGDWIARSEVDHVGPFVNAWAAFNAWYRYVSSMPRDAQALDFVRTRPNIVRSAILPMLDPQVHETPDSITFKSAIAQLHSALEGFRLETLHNEALEHVSFRSVPLRRGPSNAIVDEYRSTKYRVEKAHGQFVSTILNNGGATLISISQLNYDVAELLSHSSVVALSNEKRSRLRALYLQYNPRPMADLLSGNEPPITVGTINFYCSCEDLFGGIIVTIYRMRNMLLHGELKPDRAALSCYEPAYRLLRRMLQEIR